MCQRYVLPDQTAAEHEFLPATAWWKFAPRYNVAAPQYVPAIRLHDGQSEGVMLRWGLIPSWFEGVPEGPPKASVRDTRLEQSKIYRMPWLAGQRCILPAAGFYTWKLTPEKYRQPYFVRSNQRAVLGLAAVWDRWVSDDDDVIEGCSVISVPANGLVAAIADPQRGDAEWGMPAILRRKDYATWLRGSPAEARAALQTYSADWMSAVPVSPRINSMQADDPELIRAAR
jgi:putative SOS response-associated peptidase YedK